jgi:hypothetical protein
MLDRDDLIDIITECLGRAPKENGAAARPEPPSGRPRLFLSEYDIKKRLTGNSQELKIPNHAIISPLAWDWLTLRRIKIVRE